MAALPTQPPVAIAGQQQSAPLKAGEVDDNRDFAAYLDYLRSYSGPQARTIDISERYILTVTNERQQPVLDARVRLFDGQQQVFEGRTVAGGKTIVLPARAGYRRKRQVAARADREGQQQRRRHAHARAG